MGVFTLVGTLIAGTVSNTLGVIPVLNIQAAGKLLAGVLALALLPRMIHRPASASMGDATDGMADAQPAADGSSVEASRS
jgi:hypothetical protein